MDDFARQGSDVALPPPSARVVADEATRHLSALFSSLEKEVFSFVLQRVGNEASAFDLTQETFLRMWKARSRFDPSQDGRAWALTIAANVIRSRCRADGAQKRGRPLSLDRLIGAAGDRRMPPAEPTDHRYINPLERLVRSEEVSEMDQVAAGLGTKDRELYALSRQGLSIVEIAAKTGRSTSAVDSALSRLRDRLRRRLSLE